MKIILYTFCANTQEVEGTYVPLCPPLTKKTLNKSIIASDATATAFKRHKVKYKKHYIIQIILAIKELQSVKGL